MASSSKTSSTNGHHATYPKTLGELKASGWVSRSVKEEMRDNLMKAIAEGRQPFEGIVGYESSVIPQVMQAILAKHDILLLGLRGQAKTKLLRLLPQLLDDVIPYIEGSEIYDNPYEPLSVYGRSLVARLGDDTPIDWLPRAHRYGEKLATPDTTVADLIGDLDPIKAAANKLSLADEQVIHFGLIPRSNRGIFVINELPDLQPRIQVALLNIMQERDIQIRGFNLRIPLDLSIAFSANPEDYTNRGNIITPLKDRIDAQIITHYPKKRSIAKEITLQQAWIQRGQDDGTPVVHLSPLMHDIIEQVTFEARESDYIDQKSGVSTRLSLTAMEQVISSAERRAVQHGYKETQVRMMDIYQMVPALTGKMELVYEGEQEGAVQVAKHLIGKAVNQVFKTYFPDPQNKSSKSARTLYGSILAWFAQGEELNLTESLDDKAYIKEAQRVEGLQESVDEILSGLAKMAKADHEIITKEALDTQWTSAWLDLVLEGLHQNSVLGKDHLHEKMVYTDLVGSVLGGLGDEDGDQYGDQDEYEEDI
ncbi:MAG: magnesium chelatase [Rhodothermaeota bacterium MED-G64]|nr:MAG: magnesium chelatase [Rhodothermaeota bacterium MED-G64]RPF80215.1 MAG: magnesium chelatase [Rhodothermaceae bacterium TMED105]